MQNEYIRGTEWNLHTFCSIFISHEQKIPKKKKENLKRSFFVDSNWVILTSIVFKEGFGSSTLNVFEVN